MRDVTSARGRDSGMTLIELLVAMSLLGVVSALVLSGVVQATGVLRHTDDENRGLSDAKVVLDRLSRDIREASAATCDGAAIDPTCAAHLQLWIDQHPTNPQLSSDYVQDPAEIITWQLALNEDGIHRDVWRVAGAPPASSRARRQASALIVDTLFTYCADAPVSLGTASPATSTSCPWPLIEATPVTATVVKLTMHYDALAGAGVGTDEREATVSVRLRNKGK
jgi:prepilin-type N-terminal cleavage/methylation domain-containing protein